MSGTAGGEGTIVDATVPDATVPDAAVGPRRGHLDALVTTVARRLMPVQGDGVDAAVSGVLRELHEVFGADTVFLRRNDHANGVTVLVDEWPRRTDVPEPDPLGVVRFDADPVFARVRDLRAPYVERPATSPDAYRERVRDASGVDGVSLAMVPLLDEDVTSGVLGFVTFGDHAWSDDDINALEAIASLLSQVLARVRAEEELRRQAYDDPLTGLRNRRWLLTELERRCRDGGGGTVAVLFLDVDRFKDLNDALGHQVGDTFLAALAGRLQATLRPGDVAGRMGGDEFLVLLDPGADTAAATALADRLVRHAAVPVEVAGRWWRRTISVGVALAAGGRTDATGLLGAADAALFRAKDQGRNQAVVFDELLADGAESRFELGERLRTAIDADELELYYQPEVELASGRITAVEALLRWHHPTRGLLPAAEFIDVAEDSGLILDLGGWVLSCAARQAARWARDHPNRRVPVRVNVSPVQLRHPRFLAAVQDALADHELDGRLLSLEITEHSVMDDVEGAVRTLAAVRRLGVTVALDDFGTGYSSLNQLKRLPLDFLKIDRSFVAGLGYDPLDHNVVEAIVRLGSAFSLELIAEGVETDEQARHLAALGCRRGQGYLFSRPLTVDAVDGLVADGLSDRGAASTRRSG